MSAILWFSRIVDVGGTSSATTLIDYTVNTRFEITDHRIGILRAERWASQVNRRRGDRSVQLIVSVPDLPAEYAGANCTEAFRAQVQRLLCGW